MKNSNKWKMLYVLLSDVKHTMSILTDKEEGNDEKAKEMIEYLNNGFKNILGC